MALAREGVGLFKGGVALDIQDQRHVVGGAVKGVVLGFQEGIGKLHEHEVFAILEDLVADGLKAVVERRGVHVIVPREGPVPDGGHGQVAQGLGHHQVAVGGVPAGDGQGQILVDLQIKLVVVRHDQLGGGQLHALAQYVIHAVQLRGKLEHARVPPVIVTAGPADVHILLHGVHALHGHPHAVRPAQLPGHVLGVPRGLFGVGVDDGRRLRFRYILHVQLHVGQLHALAQPVIGVGQGRTEGKQTIVCFIVVTAPGNTDQSLCPVGQRGGQRFGQAGREIAPGGLRRHLAHGVLGGRHGHDHRRVRVRLGLLGFLLVGFGALLLLLLGNQLHVALLLGGLLLPGLSFGLGALRLAGFALGLLLGFLRGCGLGGFLLLGLIFPGRLLPVVRSILGVGFGVGLGLVLRLLRLVTRGQRLRRDLVLLRQGDGREHRGQHGDDHQQ